METLKELKKAYPAIVTTHGNIYRIKGFGEYRQIKTEDGIKTYHKGPYTDFWVRKDFQFLVWNIRLHYGESAR